VKCEAAREAAAAPPDKDAEKAKTKRHRLRHHKINAKDMILDRKESYKFLK